MGSVLKSTAVVTLATLLSRILGLGRDVATAAFMGVSPAASAFLFAFSVPNLFRRLLGEGALTSAYVPILSQQQAEAGDCHKASTFSFLNQVLSWASIALFALMLLGCAVYGLGQLWLGQTSGEAGSLSGIPLRQQWSLGLQYGIWLLPYLWLVCTAALLGATLNTLGHFLVPALSAVWLNLCLIFALLASGGLLGLLPESIAWWLVWAVLAGGLLQVAAPGYLLWRSGWRPSWQPRLSAPIRALYQLFFPALAGAGVAQANVLVSRLLAFGLNTSAVTTLYLANRLVELPLGLFAIAVATVAFPRMSQCSARGDLPGFKNALTEGLSLVMALTLPAAVGLILLSEPIITGLFGWGRFDAQAVAMTSPLVNLYAVALPAYALSTLLAKALHASKDMRTPLRAAGVAFGVNLVAGLSLAPAYGTVGLASANVLSAGAQLLMLWRGWQHQTDSALRLRPSVKGSLCLALATLGMALAVNQAAHALAGFNLPPLVMVGACVVVGLISYSTILFILRPRWFQGIRAAISTRSKQGH